MSTIGTNWGDGAWVVSSWAATAWLSTPAALVTGSVISGGIGEQDVVDGGKTIVIELVNDTWLAAGTGPVGSEANSLAILAGITASLTPANGWNNEWRDNEVFGSITRDSNTQITIVMTAAAAYSVEANEVITVTVPAEAIAGSNPIIAAPTFTVLQGGGGAFIHKRYREQVTEFI